VTRPQLPAAQELSFTTAKEGSVSNAAHRPDSIDPDYVLEMFRFHIEVFHHASDECEREDCDYCSWDNNDTWQLLVMFASSLDSWMSTRGRPPRAWTRPRLWHRLVGRDPRDAPRA
jgi:hypothetical protein